MTVFSEGVNTTKSLAKKLAQSSRGRIFALSGDLGSGKTAFAQAFLRALGVKRRIASPTFLLIKNYRLKTKKIYHIDCYRLKNPKELIKLGIKDILKDKNNIALVEWADKIKGLIPKDAVWIYFRHGKNSNERVIKITNIQY